VRANNNLARTLQQQALSLMLPFNFNTKLAARFARLHKLKRLGITPATDKASLRQAASQASQAHQPTIIHTGKRTRSEPKLD
jgi:hypothetical protein